MKEWLSPSSWTNYFRNNDKEATSQQSHDHASARNRPIPMLLSHRPQKSEALTSETAMVCENNTMDDSRAVNPANHMSSPADHTRAVSFADHAYSPAAPSRRQFAPFNKPQTRLVLNRNRNHIRKLSEGPFNNVQSRGQLPEPDRGHSSDDSETSWVAEANNEGAEAAGMVDLTVGNDSNDTDESWVAEDDGPPPSSSVNARPVSISLAHKELSSLTKDTPTTTTAQECVVGEGTAGVAQGSTFLVTPGAEVTVHCIANPVYSNRPPQVTSPEGNSSVYLGTGANKPVMTSTALKQGSKLYTAAMKTAAVPVSFAPLSPVREHQQEVVSCNRKP